MINVIHIKDVLKSNNYQVYIGRGRLDLPDVINMGLGNPFKLNKNELRGSTLTKYKEWLESEYLTNPEYKAKLDDLAEMVNNGIDIDFVCFCKPSPCHGDILKKFIYKLATRIK